MGKQSKPRRPLSQTAVEEVIRRLRQELRYLHIAQKKGPLDKDDRWALVALSQEMRRSFEAAASVVISQEQLLQLRPETLAMLQEDLRLATKKREEADHQPPGEDP